MSSNSAPTPRLHGKVAIVTGMTLEFTLNHTMSATLAIELGHILISCIKGVVLAMVKASQYASLKRDVKLSLRILMIQAAGGLPLRSPHT